jgi:hypothetical protein
MLRTGAWGWQLPGSPLHPCGHGTAGGSEPCAHCCDLQAGAGCTAGLNCSWTYWTCMMQLAPVQQKLVCIFPALQVPECCYGECFTCTQQLQQRLQCMCYMRLGQQLPDAAPQHAHPCLPAMHTDTSLFTGWSAPSRPRLSSATTGTVSRT